ncbi:hypothetical protein, unlikely [Trypanosoma brucei gambiense DAL972]|uniref:T. brucei spp.-specific protein n=1 Tax=Trypanosoma brucei gambiense (strain MHOM/CI/86/DAL972) TaxID=679716 RepID=C9ZNG0_TRYB9|nr:hypothetical protein, unlikely [Trypanosoma brucei gambiense DAL972]CBH10938.1 hypothetical protein, unlikely [Trypanosoma brucei gambiense DAL972]|eukprot:XP_011773225.1 hypothetical protein, unlikely [Trypanosoma brucei gambiense DAL972]
MLHACSQIVHYCVFSRQIRIHAYDCAKTVLHNHTHLSLVSICFVFVDCVFFNSYFFSSCTVLFTADKCFFSLFCIFGLFPSADVNIFRALFCLLGMRLLKGEEAMLDVRLADMPTFPLLCLLLSFFCLFSC